jgi:D-alanyl-D-alanine carboxypeptidase/D-alanyl-D-alanine-endopeptidase (penicillin-binding protein 4)
MPNRIKTLLSIVALGALLAGCAPQAVQQTKLEARLDEILDRRADSGAVYSARVLELETGNVLYEHAIDELRIPASNMKLLASVAGLDQYGAGASFKTYLAVDGDDLWVIGTGDPAIGDPRLAKRDGELPTGVFDDWAAALKARGLTEISGDLYYYANALDDIRTHPTWGNSVLYWYGAEISGLNFNDNCIDVTVFPTEPGQPVRYEIMPPVTQIEIINEAVTGDENDVSIAKQVGGNIYTITGTCAEETALSSKPVERPGAFFCDALRTHLEKQGITIAGEIKAAEAPLGGTIPPPFQKTVAIHASPMTDVLNRINVNSQNFFADALIKLAGKMYAFREGRDVPGSWADGDLAVREFLTKNGIDDTHLRVADGSGLSRGNRVTARLITDLLILMQTRPDGTVFRDSLSVGGVAGTLRNRFKDGYEGRVKAKTGFIGGVRALSGYVMTDGGAWLVFSFLYNEIPGSVKPFEELQDEALRLLMQWPEVPDEAPPAGG